MRNAGKWQESVLSSIASVDPQMAAQWLADTDDLSITALGVAMPLSCLVAREWVRLDPAAAAQWAPSLPDSVLRRSTNAIISDSLASTDLGAAVDFVMNLDESSERLGPLGNVRENLGSARPAVGNRMGAKLESE